MADTGKKRRPEPDEYAEYYGTYVSAVPDGDIIDILKDQLDSSLDLFAGIPEEKADFRYGPDKWSIREVIGHIIDTEWIFTYRALRMARGDQTPLPGVDQDEFMAGSNFGERRLPSLIEEFCHLRYANMKLFSSFSDDLMNRSGTASDNKFTVRSILYIIAGHHIHHVRVLSERYLKII